MDSPSDDEHDRIDDNLNESLEETFPASDAPANTVEVGVRVGAVGNTSPVAEVRKHPVTDAG